MPRTQTHEIVLDGTPDEVWRLLSEADGITRWFAPEARVSDGKLWLSYGPGMEGEGKIHLSEPGKAFGWTESGAMPKVVEFYLEGEGGKTRLRLVQSGFGEGAEFDSEYDAVNGGWRTYLAALAFGLKNHRHHGCTQIAKMSMLPGQRDAFVAKLGELLGFAKPLASIPVGGAYTADLSGLCAVHGTRLDPDKPGYFLLTIENWDQSLMGLFAEGFGDQLAVTQQWYLFGAGQEKAEALRGILPQWMESLK
jgi:uncharacterized protein YndB with AHSA1/START domain